MPSIKSIRLRRPLSCRAKHSLNNPRPTLLDFSDQGHVDVPIEVVLQSPKMTLLAATVLALDVCVSSGQKPSAYLPSYNSIILR